MATIELYLLGLARFDQRWDPHWHSQVGSSVRVGNLAGQAASINADEWYRSIVAIDAVAVVVS
ncbi:hypothetical protein B5P44_07620 [Mycobacterium sp. CBMA 213]|nr:hypothetical protein [Mycolicibacterium sp. CBMA 213]